MRKINKKATFLHFYVPFFLLPIQIIFFYSKKKKYFLRDKKIFLTNLFLHSLLCFIFLKYFLLKKYFSQLFLYKYLRKKKKSFPNIFTQTNIFQLFYSTTFESYFLSYKREESFINVKSSPFMKLFPNA